MFELLSIADSELDHCSWYWSIENPYQLHKKSLHNKKIGLQCGVSCNHIMEPIFFDTAAKTEICLRIFEEFYAQLTDDEHKNCFFQQNGATHFISHNSLACIHKSFTEEQSVRNGLWLAHLRDLSKCFFFLWGFLKNKVYNTNSHT